eukprot:510728_1
MTIIQLTLFIISIIQFRNQKNASKVSSLVKNSYLFVMIMGCLIFLIISWYGIADFIYDFAKYYKYCDIAAILGGIILATYLYALYMFFTIRLYSTFKETSFKLSKMFQKTLIVVNSLIYIALIISILILQKGEVLQVPFAWSGIKKKEKIITICAGEFSIGLNGYIRIALQIIMVFGNLFYGLLFYNKLYKVIKGFDDDVIIKSTTPPSKSTIKKGLIKIYKLMKKQTNLVAVSTVSTILLWSVANVLHYYDFFLQILIYIDVFINSVCLWLMFEWNKKYYKIYCGLCKKLNDKCCFKVFRKTPLMKTISSYRNIKNKNGFDFTQSITTCDYDNDSRTENHMANNTITEQSNDEEIELMVME